MSDIRTRFVAVLAAGLALSACGATDTKGGPISAPRATPTSLQKSAPARSASQTPAAKAANGDIKLGAIRTDAKLGNPSAEITITNHSSKRSNYIVDLSIMSADGKTKLDAAMVSSPGLAPGHTAKQVAHFSSTHKLPTGATLTIVEVARLTA